MVLKYEYGLFLPVAGASVDAALHAQQAEEAFMETLKKLTGQNQNLGVSKRGGN